MNNKIKHRGMGMTKEVHKRWHKEKYKMTPETHKALLKKMGISEEEDKEWHKTHKISQVIAREQGERPVNPFAIGGGFLAYCVKQGWLIQEGKRRSAKYYITKQGEEELKKFGIKI